MIAHTSTGQMDAESVNIMDITVSGGKTVVRPKTASYLQVAFGLASNLIYLLANTASYVRYFGRDLILVAYRKEIFPCIAPKLGSCISTYKQN